MPRIQRKRSHAVHEGVVFLIDKKYEFQFASSEEEVLTSPIQQHSPLHLPIKLNLVNRTKARISFENSGLQGVRNTTLVSRTLLLINKLNNLQII